MRARGALAAVVAVIVVVIVAVASRSARNDGPPLDPTSTAPDGTKALTELIATFGPAVDIRQGMGDVDYGPDDVLLVLEDGLGDDAYDRLASAVRGGATAVVAAGDGPQAAVALLDPDAAVAAGPCPLGWRADIGEVRGFTAAFDTGPGDAGCFGDGGQVSVLRTDVGRGRRYDVGGPLPFTNRYLAEGDNAVLASTLLAGPRTVHLIRPAPFATGDKTLFDLLPDGFFRLLFQLLVALGLFIWASAVRLGRPVREPTLWELPASSSTESVAQLYQRTGRRRLAARWLRHRARRDLLRRFQLPPDADVEQLAAMLAAAGHPQDAERYAAVLRDSDPATGEELLAVAAAIDRLRHEVSHGPS